MCGWCYSSGVHVLYMYVSCGCVMQSGMLFVGTLFYLYNEPFCRVYCTVTNINNYKCLLIKVCQ